MAARAFSKVCFSRPQRSKLHTCLLIATLAIFMSGSAGFAQDLPRVVLKGPPGIQQPATPLEICIIIAWEGDAENYTIVPPEPVFPESFSLRSSSFEAVVSDSVHQLTYRFTLVPRQTGQFTLYPVDIRCWPRDNSTQLSLLTNACTVTVAQGARLSQKKIAGRSGSNRACHYHHCCICDKKTRIRLALTGTAGNRIGQRNPCAAMPTRTPAG